MMNDDLPADCLISDAPLLLHIRSQDKYGSLFMFCVLRGAARGGNFLLPDLNLAVECPSQGSFKMYIATHVVRKTG